MNTVHLIGAEDVQRAAGRMNSAADSMQRAANSIEVSLFQHQQFLNDWLMRYEAILKQEEEEKNA